MMTSLHSGFQRLLLSMTLLLGLAMPLAAQTLTWTNATPMNTARVNAAAVVLNDGKVLVTGGPNGTAERYDPVAGTWTTINMVSARWLHRAEKLPDGRVLVIAGAVSGTRNALNTAEIYDPATGTFSAVANLAESRESFASTVLSNGKVLVHGGWNGSSVRSSGEVYDPATNTWTLTGTSVPRNSHELVTLPNGKALMISGHTGAVHGPPECYLYDPAANTWAATGSMGTGRAGPQSVVLANGKVLTTGESATCELYDPALGTWSYTGSMSVGRGRGYAILLSDGRVLAFGGVVYPPMPVSSEIYDPAAGTWSATGSAASGRTDGVAVRLQNGVVLAAGGSVGTSVFSASASANVAIFDAPPPPPAPTVASISPSVGSTAGGTSVTITGTNLTGATGVTIGGAAATGVVVTNATTITAVTPAGTAGTASVLVTTPGGTNAANTLFTYETPPSLTWTLVTPMNTARSYAAAVVLNDGKVLVTGGLDASNNVLSTAERYDPVAGTWTTISMVAGRWLHRAEKLADGRVLVISGANQSRTALNSAEIYDPATGTFSAVASLAESREEHASAVLSDGKVLVHGGWVGSSIRSSGEVYDPATNTWTATTGTNVTRVEHELVRLTNGKVLMIGGHDGSYQTTCYLYDPATNAWTATDSLTNIRPYSKNVVLSDGKVLATGHSVTCELYDPAAGTWSITGSMSTARSRHNLILLGDGRVLAIGGGNASSEIYNPATATWSAAAALNNSRALSVAVRLLNGDPLVAGGHNGSATTNTVETFDGPAVIPPPAPTVTDISPTTGSTLGGTPVTITGTGFVSPATVTFGGNAASSVVVSNDTTITAVTPAHAAGAVSVEVTTAGGTNAANTLYTYVVPNTAPTITSNGGGAAAPINVAENSTAVTTVVATDTDLPAQTITYSKSGTHAALFNIGSSTGVLTFATAPNFETNPGPFSVTVTATDNGSPNLSDSQDLTVSVTDLNDNIPTFSNIAAATTDEDTSTAALPFTVGDLDAGTVFSLSATSFDTGVIPNGNIVFGGSGANRTVTLTPAPNRHGTVTIMLTVGDGFNSGSGFFTVTVNSVNDAPSFSINTAALTGINPGINAYGLGTNGYGQLGANSGANSSSVAVPVALVSDFTQISSGDYHSAGVASDGSVWVWGRNDGGQLANGVAVDDGSANSRSRIPLRVAGLTNVIQVDAGFSWNMALKADGTVWTWGANSNGQLGLGATSGPVLTPTNVPGLTGIQKIVAAGGSAYALKSDGTLWTWGVNGNGQLGRGTAGVNEATPAVVTALGSTVARLFTAVSAHVFVERTDGTIWTWGTNYFGQGGTGASEVLSNTTPTQVTALGSHQVLTMAAGQSNSFAVMNDGTVKGFGANHNGFELGLGGGSAIQTTPVTVPGLTNIVAVSAGAGGVALNASGNVFTWGLTGTPSAPSTPTQIASLSNITDVSCGQNFFLMLGTPPPLVYNVVVVEDAGAQSVSNVVNGVSPGPADESAQTVSFTVTNTNNALFSVQPAISSDGTLTYTLAPDANGLATLSVSAVDDGGTLNGGVDTSVAKTLPIKITPINDTPTDITLSASAIAENNAANATVGTFSTTDVDVGDAFIYTLVNGAGSTDNSSFTIAGNALKLTPSANFELKNSYAIRVRSTDTGAQYFEKEFTVNITDVNEVPTDIALSSNTVLENNTAGATIGNFSASDVDAGQTHSFALVSGTGSTDNAAFTIAPGNLLTINGSADFETKTSYSIRVAATDNGALPLTFEKIFTINVLPVSESSPTAIGGTFTVAENAAVNTSVGTLTATDADAGEVFAFTLVSGAGDTDNSSFNINGSMLRVNAGIDFEAGPTRSIRVQVTDSGSSSFEQSLTVNVTNVNEVPVFVKGTSPSIPYTTAAKTVTGWATGIDDGDSTVVQALSFTVTEVGSSGLFTTAPSINSSTGTLTFTPNGTSGTATFNVSLTDDNTINGNAALTTGTQQFTITVLPAPNYTVATTGNAIVVTDTSGNGDTLTISEPSPGNIQFAATGRTFSVDGDFNINGNSGSVPLAGVTSITVNTAVGADTINVGAFTSTLPALAINGGTGNDAVNLNGAIALAAANLTVDLGTDVGDIITVNATPTLTGTATLNAKTITLNADVTGTVTGSIATAVTVALPAQIQDGINVAAATGATVQVAAGNYAEDIVIDRSLTLRGAGAATTSIVGPIGGPRAVTVLFTGNASNSIFEGFTVTRAGNNPTDWTNASLNTVGISIQFQTLSGITLRNNIVTGNRNGIDINDSNGHTIVNNVVSSNRTGMFFRNQTDNLVVEENAITGNHTAGILFFPATTNGSFQQTAANCSFRNNNISGNWYGQVQERQAGGVIPVPGTTNLKNFSGNWFGTATPTIVSTNGTEPGYAGLGVPVEFGGTAVPPVAPQPDIGGIASANLDITPLLTSGTDTNVETSPGRGTFGFQGNSDSLRVTADLAQTGATTRIQEGVNALAAFGTLAVATGSYTGDVNTSTKGVDLSAGASPGLVTITGNFTLDSNDTLPVEINSSTPGTGFDQWVVNGSVNLGGATLSLSLGYTPAPNQSFILVDNDDTDTVSGTFNGITEGATITVGSLPFKISYIGGSGNDVEMTLLNSPPEITSNGGLATASISIPENTTALTTVTATDPEVPATQSLIYSKSGPDAALFNIGSSSGVLTFAVAPDFEGTHGNTYYVTVIATDNGTPSLFDSQALTITVTDVTDPISSPAGDVVSNSGAPDATGADSGADFDVLKRGGFLSQNGTLVFPGNLLVGFGTPPVTLNDFQGIWKESGTGLKLIARTGDIAPGTTTATFNGLPNVPAISDNGDVTILGSLSVGVGGTTVSNDTGLWTQVGSGTTPSTFNLLAREGAAIPGAGGGAYLIRKFASGAYATASFSATRGAAAYSATTVGGPDKTGIFLSLINNGTVTNSVALALEGNAAPGVAGQTFGALASSYSDPARMDAVGNVAFAAILRPSNKESLWYAPISTGIAAKIFFAGDVAPGTGGATFLNLKSQAMGGAGVVTFRGLLTNNTGDNTGNLKNDGIWRGTGSNVGTYTCILRRGDTNATRPGLNLPNAADKVGNLWHSWLTNANHGAWLGQFDAGGDGTSVPAPGDTYGIYTDLSGTMTLYLLYGDPAPGIAGASFNNIDLPIVGGQEQMVFMGKVSGGGVTGSNDQGIWRSAPNGGALSLLIRTGDSITTTSGTKIIAKLDFPGSGSKARQWEQPVMDSTGRVLIFVTFTDGSTSQIIAP